MEYKTLGDRMKGYENKYRFYLIENLNTIIRLDGSHFHTFTRGLEKPFDKIFIKAMQKTTLALCEDIPGCKFGYVQSDEISLLLTNHDTFNTQPWFDNNLQKIVSVSASMCAVYFNKFFQEIVEEEYYLYKAENKEKSAYWYAQMNNKIDTAFFDSRVFVLPNDEEVVNYFIWRQQDCTRNSILSVAQSLFSHKEIQNLNTKDLQDKMFTEKDVNWNDYPTVEKRGTAVKKFDISENRKRWKIDEDIPIFSQDREYIKEVIPPIP